MNNVVRLLMRPCFRIKRSESLTRWNKRIAVVNYWTVVSLVNNTAKNSPLPERNEFLATL